MGGDDERARLTGAEARRRFRAGAQARPTAGVAVDHAQFNLAVLPEAHAADFARFCRSNAQYCPLVEALPPGERHPRLLADDADVTTDLPAYRVFERGKAPYRARDIRELWSEDSCAFLLGCSFTFESALLARGIPVRHVGAGRNVPMYRTTLRAKPSVHFDCARIVSMRGIPESRVSEAVALTARYPACHGAPVMVGDYEALGIAALDEPEFGDPPVLAPGDVPVFWACAVTALEAVANAGLPLAITHDPGHMFISDRLHSGFLDRKLP